MEPPTVDFGNFHFIQYKEEGAPAVILYSERDHNSTSSSYYDDCFLYENEVRRLHSYLSQWLEKNSEDHF